MGAHHEGHVFNIQGVKWPPSRTTPTPASDPIRQCRSQNISSSTSGSRSRAPDAAGRNSSDYLYQASADVNGVTQGLWGLLRAYRCEAPAFRFLQQRT